MNKWMPVAFLMILAAGLALRAPRLAERPMHHDEANQAYRFGMLLEEGTYEYDRDDHQANCIGQFHEANIDVSKASRQYDDDGSNCVDIHSARIPSRCQSL